MLSKIELSLAGSLLSLASERFENFGCNDLDAHIAASVSYDQWLALGRKMQVALELGDDLGDDDIVGLVQRDDLLMGYLADQLLAAGLEK